MAAAKEAAGDADAKDGEGDEALEELQQGTPQAVLAIMGVGPPTPMGQDLLQVEPPDLDDYSSENESEDEEDDARPLTREELKARTLKGIHKKANREAARNKKGVRRR